MLQLSWLENWHDFNHNAQHQPNAIRYENVYEIWQKMCHSHSAYCTRRYGRSGNSDWWRTHRKTIRIRHKRNYVSSGRHTSCVKSRYWNRKKKCVGTWPPSDCLPHFSRCNSRQPEHHAHRTSMRRARDNIKNRMRNKQKWINSMKCARFRISGVSVRLWLPAITWFRWIIIIVCEWKSKLLCMPWFVSRNRWLWYRTNVMKIQFTQEREAIISKNERPSQNSHSPGWTGAPTNREITHTRSGRTFQCNVCSTKNLNKNKSDFRLNGSSLLLSVQRCSTSANCWLFSIPKRIKWNKKKTDARTNYPGKSKVDMLFLVCWCWRWSMTLNSKIHNSNWKFIFVFCFSSLKFAGICA